VTSTRRAVILLERGREQHVIEGLVESAQAGRGRVAIVRGPAGAGKTALLRFAADRAHAGGLAALSAAGGELEDALPFGVASALLSRAVLGAEGPARESLLGGAAALARPLLLTGEPRDGEDVGDQMRLVHALSLVVLRLAEQRPLALVVDDLHWADEPSLRLLAYVARRAADLPVLLVAATRPEGERVTPVAAVLTAPESVLLAPRPLTAAAVAAVLSDAAGEPPDPDLVAACLEATGGNPQLLAELVRALDLRGRRDAARDAARVRAVGPEPVAWAVEATLRRLPGAARPLLRALCVLGDGAEVGLLVELAGVEEEPARVALSELQATGLVTGAQTVSLAHPLQRQALRERLSAADRGFLHREAARLLALRGEAAQACAHLLQAPCRGEAWAVQALLAGARSAQERAAPAEAARLLDRALSEPPDAEEYPGVLAAAGRAKAAAGDPDASATFAAAIAAARSPDERAELLLALAWSHQAHGRFDAAVRASAAGLEHAVRPELRVELTAMHDASLLWTPHAADGRVGLRPVRTDAPRTRADRIALADLARNELLRGEEDHRRVAELALLAWDDGALLADRGCDDPALPRVMAVLHNTDAPEALAIADLGLADARRRASPMGHATWRHLRGGVLAYMGRLPEAEADLRAAFDARADGWGALLPVTISLLALVLIERDEIAEAEAVLDASAAVTTHPRSSAMWATADASRGRLLLERGDVEGAVRTLEAAGRRWTQELGTTTPSLSSWRSDLVVACLRADRHAQALALAEEELLAARRWGAPRALGRALRVRAAVAPAERLACLEESVAVLEHTEIRLEHALSVVALGEALAAIDPARARETLRSGLDLAERCGATRLADRADEALRAAGARPRRRRMVGPGSLTDGERRVAELAAAGASNREIAEALFVTPKAVAFHLGNVYRKLGVPGRAGLAAALAGEPLREPASS
jgi:DNA-binding CsgD family transcriptional regulator